MSAANTNSLNKWESPKGSNIYIREIVNQHLGDVFNGSYLVTIPPKITGTVRKRRQFKDKLKAEKWAAQEWRGARNQGEDYFRATPDEKRQFVEMLPKLREKGLTVSQALKFAIVRLKPKGGEKDIDEIAQELIDSKIIRFERGELRAESFKDFKNRVIRFANEFKGIASYDLTVGDLKNWLLGLKVSPRSTFNYLSVTSEILKFGVQKRYLSHSPVDELTDHDRKELCGSLSREKEPGILTISETRRLLETAHENPQLELLGAIALGLF